MAFGHRHLGLVVALVVAAGAGCGGSDESQAHVVFGDPSLVALHTPDPQLAEAGRQAFAEGQLWQGVLPPDALRHLYISWSFIPQSEYEMTDTGAYLAPALSGIWASAPYLHNGSIPTLRALLDPALRPTRWRRSGESLNPDDVGLSYETVDTPSDRDTIEGRKVVDTTVAGMSNQGHVIALSPAEMQALLEYLKRL